MMKRTLLFVALAISATLPSCKKNGNDNNSVKTYNSVNDISVPSGFNWESSRQVPFNISITDDRFSTANHTIAVYNGDPFNGGELLAKGTANTSNAFATSLYIAKTITDVYLVKTSPDNSMIVKKVELGTGVTMSFGAIDPDAAARPAAARQMPTTLDDCSSGCTSTITTSTSGITVNTGNVICITGNNITVNFSAVNDGTIRVCGTNVTLQNMNMGGHATLLVLSGGSVNFSSLNYNSASAWVINYGTINASGSFADGGYFTNYGTFTCAGDFNLNSGSQTFTNNGTMNVGGSFNSGSGQVATNNGTLNVSSNFQANGGAAGFYNYCSLNVTGNYNQSSLVKNYSFIKVNGTSTINGGTELDFSNGAMFRTTGLINNAAIKGFGSTSLMKVTGSTLIFNGGSSAQGTLQICASSSVSASYLSGGAANGCSVYIPTTGCNTEGNGSPAVADADSDGVPDATDEYPSDATKAYNNYYPSSTGYGTVAFEDQWPKKADYDLNDVVVKYRYQVITNAANNVVRVVANYSLLATGGELGNGFGVQFPVNAGNITNVTGGTQESGQAKAVIIVFNNMRDQMTNWNTVPGAATSAPVNYTVSFDVTGAPSLSSFGLNSYNPFIWNQGLAAGRGREIHLWGHVPTDLVNTAYFGTNDDNTSVAAGRYYVTPTGLPFAIDIPTTPFNYPIEQKDITQAFLKFAPWGESGGTSYPDWYSNTASGYRNTANIYN